MALTNMLPGLDPFILLYLFFNANKSLEIFRQFISLGICSGAKAFEREILRTGGKYRPILQKTNHPK